MIPVLALNLLVLTGPDKQSIAVAPSAIVTLREPRSAEHFAPGTRCLLNMTDGKVVAVAETCDEVRALVDEGNRE